MKEKEEHEEATAGQWRMRGWEGCWEVAKVGISIAKKILPVDFVFF